MADTLERVRKIVIEHLDADPEKVTEKATSMATTGPAGLKTSGWSWASKEGSASRSPMARARPSRRAATP